MPFIRACQVHDIHEQISGSVAHFDRRDVRSANDIQFPALNSLRSRPSNFMGVSNMLKPEIFLRTQSSADGMSYYHSTPGATQIFPSAYLLAIHNLQRLAWCHPPRDHTEYVLTWRLSRRSASWSRNSSSSVWAVAQSEHGCWKQKCEVGKWLASDQMQDQGRPDGCDTNHHWSCWCLAVIGLSGALHAQLPLVALVGEHPPITRPTWYDFFLPKQRPPWHTDSLLPLSVQVQPNPRSPNRPLIERQEYAVSRPASAELCS